MSDELKSTAIQVIDSALKSAGIAALAFVVQHLQAWENNGTPLLPFSIVSKPAAAAPAAPATTPAAPAAPAK